MNLYSRHVFNFNFLLISSFQTPGLLQEGIFRRTGKLTRQQDLKTALYQGIPLNLEDGRYSVHDCASVLKSFIAELPEPLLTDLHYPAHCQISGNTNSQMAISYSNRIKKKIRDSLRSYVYCFRIMVQRYESKRM